MNLYEKLKPEFKTILDNRRCPLKSWLIEHLKETKYSMYLQLCHACDLHDIIYGVTEKISQHKIYNLFND